MSKEARIGFSNQATPRVQTNRDADHERVAAWMRDGRVDLFVAAWEQNAASSSEPKGQQWAEDPYLLLQYGVALARLDRLNEAEAAFRRTLAMPEANAAQKVYAQRQLDWLAEEWGRIGDLRAGLGRAVTVGILGFTVLGGLAACAWIVVRRERVQEVES